MTSVIIFIKQVKVTKSTY